VTCQICIAEAQAHADGGPVHGSTVGRTLRSRQELPHEASGLVADGAYVGQPVNGLSLELPLWQYESGSPATCSQMTSAIRMIRMIRRSRSNVLENETPLGSPQPSVSFATSR
jgi:hypothetical protein